MKKAPFFVEYYRVFSIFLKTGNMRKILSAIIVDPEKDKHDYSRVKTLKKFQYDEEKFDLLVLDSTEGILEKMNEFRGYDALITIGDIDFGDLPYSTFESRKKWVHLNKFNPDEIVGAIIHTFLGNIGREVSQNEKTFSIFTCAFKTPRDVFMRLYLSLCRQTYPNWNWWILDDTPNDADGNVEEWVREVNDYRITLIKNVTNHGCIGFNKHLIASACDGDYLVEVDHDDELTPDCLDVLNKAFTEFPETDFVYSDAIEVLNGKVLLYSEEGTRWGYGEGWDRHENVMGVDQVVCVSPYITPHSIRSIHLQPNHVRCWTKEFYHKIGGHETSLSVLDDMEILVRTFLYGEMTKVNKVLYIQHEGDGERENATAGTAQSERFAEIQRTDEYLKWKYDLQVHNRILELGYEDVAWNDRDNCSFLWEDHEPGEPMNNIVNFNDEE